MKHLSRNYYDFHGTKTVQCIHACVMCLHAEHMYMRAVNSIHERMKGSEIIHAAFTSEVLGFMQ